MITSIFESLYFLIFLIWNQFLSRHKNPKGEVTIGLIGKYVELQDSYKSILEAFIHAGAENEVKVLCDKVSKTINAFELNYGACVNTII